MTTYKRFVLIFLIMFIKIICHYTFSQDNNLGHKPEERKILDDFNNLADRYLAFDYEKEKLLWEFCVRIMPEDEGKSELICILKDYNRKVEIYYKYITFSLYYKYLCMGKLG